MFASESHKVSFENVIAYAREAFGESVVVADGSPLLSVPAGSAVVLVSVLPLNGEKEETIVTVRAVVVSHAHIAADLALFLLQANTTTMFGAFGITPNGDIVLEHNMIGSTLTREEFEISLVTVAQVADRVDDEIVARWGGERARDRVDALARFMDFEQADAVSH